MYYDQQIEKKLPAIYVLTNTKTQIGYDEIFKAIKSILTFGEKFQFNIETITTDNEQALINTVNKYFPEAKRISCFFHYKQTLERNAKKMGLNKKQYINSTRNIINKLGELPLIYEGNIDTISEIIDDLKSKYPDHYRYLDSFYNENLKYFINGALYYSKYPKLVRSNSILENYNKRIKEYLGKKKEINYINFLSFIKKEDQTFFKEFNLKSRNYEEILKHKNIHKYNIMNEKGYEDTNNKIITDTDIIMESDIINEEEEVNINDNIKFKGKWLKWVNNSCRFDAIMTLYLFIFFSTDEKVEVLNNEGLKILHDTIIKLLENPSSEDRYNFWSYVNIKQLDRGEHPLNFGEIGFISGIFNIFNDNSRYCLEVKKTQVCYSCQIRDQNIYYNNCLIPIKAEDLKYKSLAQIVNNKFLPSITTCKCSIINELLTASITYEILNYPEYMLFILDIDYRDYFQFVEYILEIFNKHISLNNMEYKIKGIVCMPSELHYNCYIFDNDKNYLDLSLKRTLFHDGKQNNCFIIESDETSEEVIKNFVSYILILIKQ